MYFCVHCITTKEEDARAWILNILADSNTEYSVWFPKKEVKEKRRGIYSIAKKPLFSGYVFIYWGSDSIEEFPFLDIRRIPHVIRFLRYQDGQFDLRGKDLSFAKWIHMYDGNIEQSKVVYREGQKIHICEGPLMGFDGSVVKVDKHHKRITVRFEIGETCTDVSFTVEFLGQYSKSQALSATDL